jgi:predicted glycosyltransferase
VLDAADLDPDRLLSRMARSLAAPPPATASLNLDGAAECARILRDSGAYRGTPGTAADDLS